MHENVKACVQKGKIEVLVVGDMQMLQAGSAV